MEIVSEADTNSQQLTPDNRQTPNNQEPTIINDSDTPHNQQSAFDNYTRQPTMKSSSKSWCFICHEIEAHKGKPTTLSYFFHR
jgi:hypothetical protein